jgi:hypothetical protein
MSKRSVNPMRPSSATTQRECEELAERFMFEGFSFIAQALNLTDNPKLPYAWDQATRARVTELLTQLMRAKMTGTLSLRAGAVAQGDAGLQRFLASLATNTTDKE